MTNQNKEWTEAKFDEIVPIQSFAEALAPLCRKIFYEQYKEGESLLEYLNDKSD